MRSMVEGALWAMFDFYRERVVIGSGAPIVTPTACHFYTSRAQAPFRRGKLRKH